VAGGKKIEPAVLAARVIDDSALLEDYEQMLLYCRETNVASRTLAGGAGASAEPQSS